MVISMPVAVVVVEEAPVVMVDALQDHAQVPVEMVLVDVVSFLAAQVVVVLVASIAWLYAPLVSA